MAGNAVSADHTLVFELGQVSHLRAQLVGPLGGTHAVQQHQVEVIRANFLEKPRHDDVGCRSLRFGQAAGVNPDLGDDSVLVPRYSLQGRDEIRMRAVEVSHVEEPDAAVIGALDESVESLLPHPRMIGLTVAAVHPGAEAKTTHLEFGPPERDGLVWVKLAGLRFRGPGKLHAGEYPAYAEG